MKNIQNLAPANNRTPKTATIEEEAAEIVAPPSLAAISIKQRVKALGRVEKPGGTSRIRLTHSIDYKPHTVTFPGYTVNLRIPAWASARSYYLHEGSGVNAWTSGAKFLNDPFLGAVAQQRFVERWAAVLESKDFWLNRDKGATVRHTYNFREIVWENITAAAEFLEITREVLLVGIVCSNALTSTVHSDLDPATVL